jgi:YggT family protein
MSWFIRDPRNQFAIFIYTLTEPILSPFRQLLKKLGVGGMLDFSPIVALLCIQLIANVIYSL